MSGRLLTIEELCAKLGGVRPWTISSWVSQRRIPYTKVGRLTRFPEGPIDAWIRANTVEPDGALSRP
jgi:excisionase family DNA binding protein